MKIKKDDLKNLIKTAKGDEFVPHTTLIKNISILDLVTGEILKTNLLIYKEWIAGFAEDYGDNLAETIIDGTGKFVVPGFIDGHLHLESSSVNPFEFEAMTLPLGTTTLVSDPHEIANVLGRSGVEWMLRCSDLMKQQLYIQLPSCVPSLPGVETAGSAFTLKEMESLRNHPNVLGLAEMMNFPGVINGDDEVLDKILSFEEEDLHLDGHSPMLTGKNLNAYLAAGIQNCHETVGLKEAKEKLQKGMSLILREGSVAKNLADLVKVVSEFNSPQCFLCTDDRNPMEVASEGHLNFMIKKMIQECKIPVHVAYRLSSFSAAKHFKLRRQGLVAPGYRADLVLLNNLEKVEIYDVMMKGKLVSMMDFSKEKRKKLLHESRSPLANSVKRKKVEKKDLPNGKFPAIYNIIEVVEKQLITKHLKEKISEEKYLNEDYAFLYVAERHGHNKPITMAMVKGMGVREGVALGQSVAHDSHNLLVVAKKREDAVFAFNYLRESQGGIAVVQHEKIVTSLDLPIAGLISLDDFSVVQEKLKKLIEAYKERGGHLEAPFIQLAFLSLPVIGELKLTDYGLFSINDFQFHPPYLI